MQEVLSDGGEDLANKGITRPILAGLAAVAATESGLNSEGV